MRFRGRIRRGVKFYFRPLMSFPVLPVASKFNLAELTPTEEEWAGCGWFLGKPEFKLRITRKAATNLICRQSDFFVCHLRISSVPVIVQLSTGFQTSSNSQPGGNANRNFIAVFLSSLCLFQIKNNV